MAWSLKAVEPTTSRICAACSSSLLSLHMAFNSLLLGNISKAANSGANLMLSGTRAGRCVRGG